MFCGAAHHTDGEMGHGDDAHLYFGVGAAGGSVGCTGGIIGANHNRLDGGKVNTTIQELHREVWQFRREMERYFPTPSQADSIAFAFTEIAEAVDATLRQNPLYKRNQEKAHSVERELAQCAMMLLTAVPENAKIPSGFVGYTVGIGSIRLQSIAKDIACAYAEKDKAYQENQCLWAVSAINHFFDLPTHLRAELARMRAKHAPVQDDGPASMNEVANESVIYTDRMERIILPNPKDNPASYTANEAGEWVIV